MVSNFKGIITVLPLYRKKEILFLFINTFYFLLLTLYCSAQNLESLLGPGISTESMIATGKIKFRETIHNHSSMPGIMRIKDSRLKAIELDYEKNKPEFVTNNYTVTFDNNKKILISRRESSTKIVQHSYYNEHVNKNWFINSSKGRDYKVAHVQKAFWPPGWPLFLWQSRSLTLKSSALNSNKLELKVPEPSDRQHTFVLIGKGAGVDWHVRTDIAVGGLITHIDQIDRHAHTLYCITDISYKRYTGNLIYPDFIKETRFVYDSAGKQSVEAEVESQVIDSKLNIRLSDNDLDFGLLPKGATVYDTRFKKEIVYEQGEKQLSDRELFEISKNPHLLEKLTAPSRPPVYPPVYQIAVMILIPFIGMLLFIRFRQKRKRS